MINNSIQTRTIKNGLGKNVSTVGKKIAIVGGGVIAYDIIKNNKVEASHVLDAAMVGVGFIPVVGPAISAIYLVGDIVVIMTTGNTIGDHLNQVVGGPLIERLY